MSAVETGRLGFRAGVMRMSVTNEGPMESSTLWKVTSRSGQLDDVLLGSISNKFASPLAVAFAELVGFASTKEWLLS